MAPLADSSSSSSKSCSLCGTRTSSRPPVQDRDVLTLIGQPLEQMLSSLFDLETTCLSKACQIYSAEYLRLAQSEKKLFDDALPLVKALHKEQFKLAIATGKSQNGADNATKVGLTLV